MNQRAKEIEAKCKAIAEREAQMEKDKGGNKSAYYPCYSGALLAHIQILCEELEGKYEPL